MSTIATESYAVKHEVVARLADRYDYDPWRVWILDMQRASLRLPDPPRDLLPADLRDRYRFATLVLQGNGFTFTTSETSSGETATSRIETPYHLSAGPCKNETSALALTYAGVPVSVLQPLDLVEIMGRPSDYYFAFKEPVTRRPLHTYLVVNPFANCAYRCRYCSRLPYFGSAPRTYKATLERTVREVLAAVSSPRSVRFVNIITGSLASAEADIALCQDVIDAFARAGFGHCEYGVYTSSVRTREQMEQLRQSGVVFFTVTVETTTAEARYRLHEARNPKRHMSFDDVVAVIRTAEEIFPCVNTTMMLGYEPADCIKRNFDVLWRETGVTINHYIPRIWSRHQHDLIHPTARTLDYYVDLFAFIERGVNAGRRTVGAFFEGRFGIPQFTLRYRS
jgi:radical SAM family protein